MLNFGLSHSYELSFTQQTVPQKTNYFSQIYKSEISLKILKFAVTSPCEK